MRLYALTLVKDEADVIGQAIRHAATFCDRVAVLDNGSSDDTWSIIEEIAKELPDVVIPWGVEERPFERRMRGLMYDELRHELEPDDWFMQLDADEFLMGDPRPALAAAGRHGYNRVRTWQAQFRFTDIDLARWEAGLDDREVPIERRRNYFEVDWREPRFWRNDPQREWGPSNASTVPDFADRVSPRSLVNRHYQHRDPEQIQRRIDIRRKVRSDEAFPHVDVEDWRERLVPAEGLRRWEPGQPLRPFPWRYYRSRIRSALRPD